MIGRRSRIGFLGLAAAAAVVSVGFIAAPGPASCATIDFADVTALNDGTLVPKGASASERDLAMTLAREARARIAESFGAPIARPVLVMTQTASQAAAFGANSYGSTYFVGTRACVIIGPDGANTDVVAHELMHAEIFERVGPWARWAKIPTWFDEGLAMQVDARPAYDLATPPNSDEVAGTMQLRTEAKFFSANNDTLKRNYINAKAVVESWVRSVGQKNVYARLQLVRSGQPFQAMFDAD